MNAITYKEVFPLFMENRVWLGESIHSGDRQFGVPDCYELIASTCGIDEFGKKFIRVKGVRWFTKVAHPSLAKCRDGKAVVGTAAVSVKGGVATVSLPGYAVSVVEVK